MKLCLEKLIHNNIREMLQDTCEFVKDKNPFQNVNSCVLIRCMFLLCIFNYVLIHKL